jgi:predicted DNA binding CopG/RHH family protein
MPKKPIVLPRFKSEAEEAKWWDAHPDVATEIMKRAIKSGKARRAIPLKTVTMRLPVPDLEAAQELAARKRLPYQTYIKMLLHEALEKERRSA